jgi:hypothetical protein
LNDTLRSRTSSRGAGVEPGVDDVHDRVGDRDEERAVDDRRHDHRQVECDQRAVRQEADARQPEHDLGQQRAAADEHGEVEAEQRDERDHRRAQHVPREDAPLG